MTGNVMSGQPGDQGSETTDPLSAIATWQAASHQTNSKRSFRPAAMRSFIWIVVVIAGILAIAATFPALLGTSGQPLVIHNPHVQR
jgi:hypothetical protein